MYRVIQFSCFLADYNSIVLPHIRCQQRYSTKRWIGRQWLRSNFASNHISMSLSMYQPRMFPFSQNADMVALLPFPHHHIFSSSHFFLSFFFFYSFFRSFSLFFLSPIFNPSMCSTLFSIVFSSSIFYFTLPLPHLPFLVFLFFSPSSTAIGWHNNKLIRS